jgi:hypothetical protein
MKKPVHFGDAHDGCVQWGWSATPDALANPMTRFTWKAATATFRAEPKQRKDFVPGTDERVFSGQLLDADLYRVTQQDYLNAAARPESKVAAPIDSDSVDDPPPDLAPKVRAALTGYRQDSILIVNAPKVDGKDKPGTAEAIDASLKQSADAFSPNAGNPVILHAEDVTTGVTVYVRDANATDKRWRSLCRRVVRVTSADGKTPLAHFDDDPAVGAAVNFQSQPSIGTFVTIEKSDKPQSIEGDEIITVVPIAGNSVWPVTADTVYSSPYATVAGPDFMMPGDYLLGVIGSDDTYARVAVTPPMRIEKNQLLANDSLQLVTVKGIGLRDGETTFVAVNLLPTGIVDKTGKPVEKWGDWVKASHDVLIEGERSLILADAGAKIVDPIGKAEPWGTGKTNDALLISPTIPPVVLRPLHLLPSDQVVELAIPKPAELHAKRPRVLIPTFDVVTPLRHRRGLVESVAFDLEVNLQRRIDPIETPFVAFLQFAKDLWYLDFPNDPATITTTDDGMFSCPRLFPNQRPTLVAQADDDHYRMDNTDGGWAIDLPAAVASTATIGETVNVQRVRLSGVVESTTSDFGNARVTFRVERIATLSTGGAPWNLRYGVRAVPESGEAFVVPYSLQTTTDAGQFAAHFAEKIGNDPAFVHPADTVGFWLDFIDDPQNPSAARAWPQALPGTAFDPIPNEPNEMTVFRSFAAIDGFRSPSRATNPGDANRSSGYFLVHPIRFEEGSMSELPSSRFVELRNPALPGNVPPACWYLSWVTSLGLTRRSSVIWKVAEASPVANALPLVGEVGKFEAKDGLTIDLVTRDRGRAALKFPTNHTGTFPAAFSPTVYRHWSDLIAGELILLYGQVDPNSGQGDNGPGLVNPVELEAGIGHATAVVRGDFRLVPTVDSRNSASVNPSLRSVIVTTPLGTTIVAIAKAEGPWKDIPDGIAVAQSLLVAETITEAGATAPKEKPVQALATDLHAKWANWCLTVPMPGDAAAEEPVERSLPYAIHCERHRGNLALPDPALYGPYEMLPLRYGRTYEFLLRRADLAGNHLFHEGAPPDDAPASAVRRLAPLVTESDELKALRAVVGGIAHHADESRFTRPNPPSPMVLAWPVERQVPIWESKAPAATPLWLTAFPREPLLILFSDVFDRVHRRDDDAKATLLPAPATVETVILSGALDAFDPAVLPNLIRTHERYATHGVMGLDRTCTLNYFGDPTVVEVEIDVVHRRDDRDPASTSKRPGGAAVRLKPHGRWPGPCPIDVTIVPGDRAGPAATSAERANAITIEPITDAKGHGLTLAMPLGSSGWLRSRQVVRAGEWQDSGQRVRVLHISNAPRTAPEWLALEAADPKTDDTARTWQGRFRADIPTSDSFAMSASWNECWDERLPLGWEEATFPKTDVANGTIPISATGYGYGSQAVALVVPKDSTAKVESWPRFEPTVLNGRCTAVRIAASPGWHTLFDVRLIRRPPLYRAATATVDRSAHNDESLQPGDIRIDDPGGWYVAPPHAIVTDEAGTGYGAKVTAILNGSGGVAAVRIDAAGCRYSKRVRVDFATHVEPFPPVSIPRNARSTELAIGPATKSFADARSRAVSFRLDVSPRYEKYLLPERDQPPATQAELLRTPIRRSSVLRPSVAKSSMVPMPPNVAPPLLAFHWAATDGAAAIDDPASYFAGKPTGWLTLTRTEAIRVYLRRPWHQSGTEQLGIVLVEAITNTTQKTGPIEANAGVVVNRWAMDPTKHGEKPGAIEETLPSALRESATRWGYDPIWPERALPPLTVGHFPLALPGAPAWAVPAGGQVFPCVVARHEVRYDAAKNLWYADVVVDANDRTPALNGQPFVRLQLVTWQEHAIAECRASSPVTTDPIPLGGGRRLVAERKTAGLFRFELSGPIAANEKQKFPMRRVVVELQRKAKNAPPDVEVMVDEGQRYDRAGHVVREAELKRDDATGTYAGDFAIPPAMLADSAAAFTVVVREDVYVRTLADQPSGLGDRTEFVNGVRCAVVTMSSFRFGI